MPDQAFHALQPRLAESAMTYHPAMLRVLPFLNRAYPTPRPYRMQPPLYRPFRVREGCVLQGKIASRVQANNDLPSYMHFRASARAGRLASTAVSDSLPGSPTDLDDVG